jgi:integrase
MGITLRGNVRWISYSLPKEVAAEFGVKTLQRESADTGDKRVAASLLAQRKREIANGTWRPKGMTGDSLLVSTYAASWTAERKRRNLRSADRDADRLRPFMKRLGGMRLADVRRSHVKAAVADMMAMRQEPATGKAGRRTASACGAYAPGSVLVHYDTLKAMFGAAVREELILGNPCTLRSADGELPKDVDADPRWRAKAVYARGELEQLISDDRIPLKRRVLYALYGVGGMRKGEGVARSWDDYDATLEPLGRLSVHSQWDGRRLKTDHPRDVPVHPVLAALLAEWKLVYERECCAKPTGEALICPNALGRPFSEKSIWEHLQLDLERLGMRPRRVHDLRRTFISLARADGAGDLLRWVTHGPTSSVFDAYTTPPWPALCEQVSKLRIELRTRGAKVRALPGKRSA